MYDLNVSLSVVSTKSQGGWISGLLSGMKERVRGTNESNVPCLSFSNCIRRGVYYFVKGLDPERPNQYLPVLKKVRGRIGE